MAKRDTSNIKALDLAAW